MKSRFLFAIGLLTCMSLSLFAADDPYLAQLVGDSSATKQGQSTTSTGNPGEVDTTFAANGAIDFSSEYSYATTDGPGRAIVRVSDGSMFIASSDTTNTQTKVIKVDPDGNKVTNFGSSGVLTIAGLVNVNHLFVDQGTDIIVAGGQGSSGSQAGWLKRYAPTNGSEDTVFAVADADSLDLVSFVAQQSSGRIIVAGQKDGNAAIAGYDPITGALDLSFGSSDGIYYSHATEPAFEIAIDSQDRIYFLHSHSSMQVSVERLHPDGKTVDWTTTTHVADVSRIEDSHLVLDQNGRPVLATVNNSGANIVMYQFNKDTDGVAHLNNITLDATETGLGATMVLQGVAVDEAGKFILVGYRDIATDIPFVIRVDADFQENVVELDTTFNAGGAKPGVQTANGGMTTSNDRYWNDCVIAEDGRIYVLGGTSQYPYLLRLYGDQYIAELDGSIAAGAEGTLDTTMDIGNVLDTDAAFDLRGLHASLNFAGITPVAMLGYADGGHLIAFHDTNNSVSKLVRVASDNTLNTLFNMGGVVPGIAVDAPNGVTAMLGGSDGSVVLGGNDGSTAWLKRYISTGIPDQTFGNAGLITFANANFVVDAIQEQGNGRIVVAGYDATYNTNAGSSFVRAFNPNDGSVDATFATNGVYTVGSSSSAIQSMMVDTFNRIIFVYKNGADLAVARLLSQGTLDTSFGTSGVLVAITGIETSNDNIVAAIDVNGDIVVAARKIRDVSAQDIAVRKYDNATGAAQYAEFNLGLTDVAAVTDIAPTIDQKTLIAGYRTGNNQMFVARITDAGALDSTFGVGGILDFKITTSTQDPRALVDMLVRVDGRISLLGYEEAAGTKLPFLARAYGAQYQLEVEQNIGLIPEALPDEGLDGAVLDDQGFYTGKLFYLETGSEQGTLQQKARAIAMQDDDKYLIAADGRSIAADAESKLFVSRFNLDGQLDTSFSTNGWDQLPHVYKDEFVNDMIVFSTGGVQKAVLAGYVQSGAPLNLTQSLLIQYDLTNAIRDTTFGGLHDDGSGSAFGDAQSFYKVARQSNGRLIAGGLDFSGNGSLVAYNKTGSLDTTFGQGGHFVQGATGIYSYVIDAQDRVVVVYTDGSGNVEVARILADGSGLDSSFGLSGNVATADRITSAGTSSNVAVALDRDGKIVVAAVTNTNAVTVQRYFVDGSKDGNALTVSSIDLSSLSLLLTKITVDADNKIYLFLTDDDPQDDFIVARITADMAGLDQGFNPFGATPGRILYRVDVNSDANSVRRLTDALIQDEGFIVVTGYEEQP